MIDEMLFASAVTTEADLEAATSSIVGQIRHQLHGEKPDLALLFFSPHFDPVAAFIAESLQAALKPGLLVGCGGQGVIGREQEIERQPAITLVAAQLPGVDLVPFYLSPKKWPELSLSPSAFRRTVKAPKDTKLIMMLADPLTMPVDEVLDVFNDWYPGIPINGGLASSGQQLRGNVLVLNERVYTAGALGISLGGAFEVDVIVSQGCRPIGRALEVTQVDKNVIMGLEGGPPLSYLEELVSGLSNEDQALLQNGLYIGRSISRQSESLGRGDFLIRGVLGVDHDTGAIAVGDHVTSGETVQFHLRDATTATEDLEMMLAPQALFDTPRGAFLFTCNGRGTHLYNYPNGDINTIQGILGGVDLAGFFCAGEIGPIGGRNFLHGQTASMVLFRPQESK
jgi:small ligand-binding sensory domain FIST